MPAAEPHSICGDPTVSRMQQDLIDLVACHSTPGDEDEVASFLRGLWSGEGLLVESLGRYAVTGRWSKSNEGRRRILVCAHMDSPGYAIESVCDGTASAVELGTPRFEGDSVLAVLKRGGDHRRVLLRREEPEEAGRTFSVDGCPDAQPGDRVCFPAESVLVGDGLVTAPFLDNRLGCTVLGELARCAPVGEDDVELILGATCCEEMGGFGAQVLARSVAPDLAICLDATYEAPSQNVRIGAGPVLTLSDASVLLGQSVRDWATALFAEAGIPLQTEVYNYSGTDARAFPGQGLPALVLPLLMPSLGNHSPEETASLGDVEGCVAGIMAVLDYVRTQGLPPGVGEHI